MRRPDSWQPDALRQHGGAAEIFSRRHFRAVVVRCACGQAGGRVHVDRLDAWRTGIHAAVDDAAASASRHVAGWRALHRSRIVEHHEWRHAVRCFARLWHGHDAAAINDARRTTLLRAWQADRGARFETRGEVADAEPD